MQAPSSNACLYVRWYIAYCKHSEGCCLQLRKFYIEFKGIMDVNKTKEYFSLHHFISPIVLENCEFNEELEQKLMTIIFFQVNFYF